MHTNEVFRMWQRDTFTRKNYGFTPINQAKKNLMRTLKGLQNGNAETLPKKYAELFKEKITQNTKHPILTIEEQAFFETASEWHLFFCHVTHSYDAIKENGNTLRPPQKIVKLHPMIQIHTLKCSFDNTCFYSVNILPTTKESMQKSTYFNTAAFLGDTEKATTIVVDITKQLKDDPTFCRQLYISDVEYSFKIRRNYNILAILTNPNTGSKIQIATKHVYKNGKLCRVIEFLHNNKDKIEITQQKNDAIKAGRTIQDQLLYSFIEFLRHCGDFHNYFFENYQTQPQLFTDIFNIFANTTIMEGRTLEYSLNENKEYVSIILPSTPNISCDDTINRLKKPFKSAKELKAFFDENQEIGTIVRKKNTAIKWLSKTIENYNVHPDAKEQLKILLQNGIKLTSEQFDNAVKQNSIELIDLITNHSPSYLQPIYKTQPSFELDDFCNIKMLEYLLQNNLIKNLNSLLWNMNFATRLETDKKAQIVELLLKHEVSINHHFFCGVPLSKYYFLATRTLLHEICGGIGKRTDIKLMELLLKNGADPNALTQASEKHPKISLNTLENTPLMITVKTIIANIKNENVFDQGIEVIELLLKYGANPDISSANGANISSLIHEVSNKHKTKKERLLATFPKLEPPHPSTLQQQVEETQRAAAAIMIVNVNQNGVNKKYVLLGDRSGDIWSIFNDRMMAFPGGSVTSTHTFEQTARRELLEETGINLNDFDTKFKYRKIYSYNEIAIKKDYGNCSYTTEFWLYSLDLSFAEFLKLEKQIICLSDLMSCKFYSVDEVNKLNTAHKILPSNFTLLHAIFNKTNLNDDKLRNQITKKIINELFHAKIKSNAASIYFDEQELISIGEAMSHMAYLADTNEPALTLPFLMAVAFLIMTDEETRLTQDTKNFFETVFLKLLEKCDTNYLKTTISDLLAQTLYCNRHAPYITDAQEFIIKSLKSRGVMLKTDDEKKSDLYLSRFKFNAQKHLNNPDIYPKVIFMQEHFEKKYNHKNPSICFKLILDDIYNNLPISPHITSPDSDDDGDPWINQFFPEKAKSPEKTKSPNNYLFFPDKYNADPNDSGLIMYLKSNLPDDEEQANIILKQILQTLQAAKCDVDKAVNEKDEYAEKITEYLNNNIEGVNKLMDEVTKKLETNENIMTNCTVKVGT